MIFNHLNVFFSFLSLILLERLLVHLKEQNLLSEKNNACFYLNQMVNNEVLNVLEILVER